MFFCFVDKVPFHVVDDTIDRDYNSSELDALLATAPETNDEVPEIGPEMDDGEKSRFGYCDCNKFYGLEDPTGEDGGFCESRESRTPRPRCTALRVTLHSAACRAAHRCPPPAATPAPLTQAQ
jgi:hypothetical protein